VKVRYSSQHTSGLEVIPNAAALRRRRATQIGDRVWNEELKAVQVAVMGGWELERMTADEAMVTLSDDPVHRLKGYSFALTGKMWAVREDVEATIRSAGGKIAHAMVDSTILVAGDLSRSNAKSTKKLRAAKERGLTVISVVDLQAALKGQVRMSELLEMGRLFGSEKRTPVDPIDRERQQRTVKQVFEDIEAIVFRK
jgi:hypothetical protein